MNFSAPEHISAFPATPDRDHRSAGEIADLADAGVRVLSRRHLEAFLLDDEVLTALRAARRQPEKTDEVLRLKRAALKASVERGNDADDVKSAAGSAYTAITRTLQLTDAGNSTDASMSDTLAPLIQPGMAVYAAAST